MSKSNDNNGNGKRLVVIGAGPGGYPAAFRAAELGFDVTLIDPRANPGGVCLFEGCIPSKTLLHAARLIHESRESEEWGISFGKPKIDLDKLRSHTEMVIKKLTGGLGALGKQHKVHFVRGHAEFVDAHKVKIRGGNNEKDREVGFDHAIVATGSQPVPLPGFDVGRSAVWDSTEALKLEEVPKTLLVIGGGYIGLEMGTIYSALGARVTVVEMLDQLVPGADPELVEPLRKRLEGNGPAAFEEILLGTKVAGMEPYEHGVSVRLKDNSGKELTRKFSKVLVAIGRKPNTEDLGLENTKVKVGQDGFIEVDERRRTTEPHIYAVGDVAGEPMLAHKATHEGRTAAEAAAGKPVAFAPAAIPAVIFTDPEIAWTGLTETKAREEGIQIEVARFPWAASGRATSVSRNEGLTKLIIEPRTERILGVGITGVGAGELIAEGTLAVEMGARVSDLGMTIHPHPTLSETLMEAADVFYGHSAHYKPRSSRG